MRSDAEKRLAHFAKLISQILHANDPSTSAERNGATWAAMSQSAWCAELGFTARTLRTLAKCPPVVSERVKRSGSGTMVLYRLRTANERKPAKAIASKMAGYFKAKFNKKVTPREYGCLNGLAEIWPMGIEFNLFKLVIEEWSEFCSGVKIADPEPDVIRYYVYPTIPFIRKYHAVAVEMHMIRLQAKQQWPGLKLSGTVGSIS